MQGLGCEAVYKIQSYEVFGCPFQSFVVGIYLGVLKKAVTDPRNISIQKKRIAGIQSVGEH